MLYLIGLIVVAWLCVVLLAHVALAGPSVIAVVAVVVILAVLLNGRRGAPPL